MTTDEPQLERLVRELIKLPAETPWVEFKRNNKDPDTVGQYISALANAAALEGKANAYLVWGIADGTHEIVGTNFDPFTERRGSEPLENWLLRLLEPKINFQFRTLTIDGKPVVILEVERAYRHPVRFSGQESIRVGAQTKPLKDLPERERALWRALDHTPFERGAAASGVSEADVLHLIDYPAYFELMKSPLPEQRSGIVERLAADQLIAREDNGLWEIRNLGAILFARRLADFERLRRKAVRVIVYHGKGKAGGTVREHESERGYAAAFTDLIAFINSHIPSNEVMGQALRRAVPMYPELAVRELVANALIHQDFSVGGSSPMVELFADRLEITNPGQPLVDTQRLLDLPPRSRNEALASLMRRMGICEERGSGVDKVVSLTELHQLPPPAFEIVGESTRSTLFAQRPLNRMALDDRIRAVYLHASLRYVENDFMTNSSLRERWGIDVKNSAIASRLIKEALEAGRIRLHDAEAAPKFRKYVPSWA